MGRKVIPNCLVCGKKLQNRKTRFCNEACENTFLNYRNKLANLLKRLHDLGASCEYLTSTFNLTELEVKQFILRASTVINPAVRESLMPKTAPKETEEEREMKLLSFARFEKLTSNKYLKPKKVFVNGQEWVDFDKMLKDHVKLKKIKKVSS